MHATLLRDVRRRAAQVLAMVAARPWPEAELRVLTGLLRAAVLGQAFDEHVRLYPNDAAPPSAAVSAEHIVLHALAGGLDHLEAPNCTLPELAQMVDQMLAVLEHHLIAE